jgi:hypothetical protein
MAADGTFGLQFSDPSPDTSTTIRGVRCRNLRHQLVRDEAKHGGHAGELAALERQSPDFDAPTCVPGPLNSIEPMELRSWVDQPR